MMRYHVAMGSVLRERAAADPRRWSYEVIGYKKRQNSKGHKKAAGPKPRRRSLKLTN